MIPVTLPGDLHSPVAGALLDLGCRVKFGLSDGVVFRICLREGHVQIGWTEGAFAANEVPTKMLALDLGTPNGMDRAARWLAAHHGLQVGATAPGWHFCPPALSLRDADGAPFDEDYPAGWTLSGADDFEVFTSPVDDEDGWVPNGWHAVPGNMLFLSPAAALVAACLAACGRGMG